MLCMKSTIAIIGHFSTANATQFRSPSSFPFLAPLPPHETPLSPKQKATNEGGRTAPGFTSGHCLTKPSNQNTRVHWSTGCRDVGCDDNSQFEYAIQLIKTQSSNGLNAVLVGLGLSQRQESEGDDRRKIELPGTQNELIETVYNLTTSLGVPLVCFMIHGGTLALGDALEQCDVILDGWLSSL